MGRLSDLPTPFSFQIESVSIHLIIQFEVEIELQLFKVNMNDSWAMFWVDCGGGLDLFDVLLTFIPWFDWSIRVADVEVAFIDLLF